MNDRIRIAEVVDAYTEYVSLIDAIGLSADRAAIRDYAIRGLGYKGSMKSFFDSSHAQRYPKHTAPRKVLDTVDGMKTQLFDLVRERLKSVNGRLPSKLDVKEVASVVSKLDVETRQSLHDSLLKSEQKKFFKKHTISVVEFRAMLGEYAGEETIARTKLISHIKSEFEKHGIKMSFNTIEEYFRPNAKVRHVPHCAVEVIKNLDESFLTGLIPITSMTGGRDPSEWLAEQKQKFCFRTETSMHRAIAECAELNYESVHKALRKPREGQRLQKRIKACFEKWRKVQANGQPIPVDPKYLGVEGEEVRAIITKLRGYYKSNEMMYREMSSLLGTTLSTVRRYCANHSTAKYVPVENFQKLQELLEQKKKSSNRLSYLSDPKTRQMANVMSAKLDRAFENWQSDRDNFALRAHYKQLRLHLIMALKERRTDLDLHGIHK